MAVSISGTSGTWSHGSSVTISGSGFGTKTTAAPAVWDDCSGSDPLAKWTGAWPNEAAAAYNLDYRGTTKAVAFPHSRVSQYLCGAHAGSGSTSGYDVGGWLYRNSTLPVYLYMSFYTRCNPDWGNLNSPRNWKFFSLADGSGPYGGDWFGYIDLNMPSGIGSFSSFTAKMNGFESPDQNGHSNWWNAYSSDWQGWRKCEIEALITTASNGFIRYRKDGFLVCDYLGYTIAPGYGPGFSVSFGGYTDPYNDVNAFRFFNDIYLDYTLQRVILANNPVLANATVREVQIPTAWNNTSITVNVNLATFTTGTAYLFVFDATGASNTTNAASTITVDGGSPVIIPVSAFSPSVASGQAPLTVSFTDQSTNNPTAWAWSFGANSSPATSILQNPSTTYSAGGAKTVSLTASNSAGADATPATTTISVRYLKPTNFQAS